MSVLWSVLAGIGTVLLFLLKGVGILLLVVLVLGLLLMFCPFCADVQWAEGIFQVKAGALGITFPVFRYPAPEKPEKKKKEKKKKASGAQKPKKEAPPRQKAKLTLQIVCTILKGAGKRRAHRKGSRLLPGHGPGLRHRFHASARSVCVLARKGTGRFYLARV